MTHDWEQMAWPCREVSARLASIKRQGRLLHASVSDPNLEDRRLALAASILES